MEKVVEKLIAEHLPAIKETFQKTVGAGALKAANSDSALELIIVKVHKSSLLAVRWIIKRTVFVRYYFDNRDKLLRLMEEES